MGNRAAASTEVRRGLECGDNAAPSVKLLVAVLSLVVAVGSWSQAPGALSLARVALAAWGVVAAAHAEWAAEGEM